MAPAEGAACRGRMRRARIWTSALGGLFLASATPLVGIQACSSKFQLPGPVPLQALDYNGVRLADVCFMDDTKEHNVFVIGDWGGIVYGPHMPPIPADKRSKMFLKFHREFIVGVDDRAQLKVAEEMRKRSVEHEPDYILNMGDNFYWGGVNGKCGHAPFEKSGTGQFETIFENVYWGAGLDGKTWLGVLGNHDWGGYMFTAQWEENIGYSWRSDRWMTPALYYMQRVNYPDFSAEYFFMDTNVFETFPPDQVPFHNICGLMHSGADATCVPSGPRTVWDCPQWFADIWDEQSLWVEEKLDKSTATWQIIVTHMPPIWGRDKWDCLAKRHGVDLFVGGHKHSQELWTPEQFTGTSVIISGGGGGITSEGIPDVFGEDDEYGFVHLTLTAQSIKIQGISHSGVVRKDYVQHQRAPDYGVPVCSAPVGPEHFAAVDGGADRGCRGKNSTEWKDEGNHVVLLELVATLKSCQHHCRTWPGCQGIEYGSLERACMLWTTRIASSAPIPGMACMRLAAGAGIDVQPRAAQPPAPGPSHKFGEDRACRGLSVKDVSDSYYQDQGEIPSLAGCERLCLNLHGDCTGLEYGPGKLCKLWTQPIHMTAVKKGVICLPQGSEKHDVHMVEAENQLHV